MNRGQRRAECGRVDAGVVHSELWKETQTLSGRKKRTRTHTPLGFPALSRQIRPSGVELQAVPMNKSNNGADADAAAAAAAAASHSAHQAAAAANVGATRLVGGG